MDIIASLMPHMCDVTVVCHVNRFHPPNPPYYDFDHDKTAGEFTLALADEVPSISFTNFTSHIVVTKQNTCVPLGKLGQ